MTRAPKKPTVSELDVLRVLWARGPSTVREVLDGLKGKREMGYTGALKLLQIMTAKGLVRRDERERAHVYQAFRPAGETKRQLARDMLARVFEGSAAELMLHVLAGRRTSRAELEALRKILDRHGEKEDGKPD